MQTRIRQLNHLSSAARLVAILAVVLGTLAPINARAQDAAAPTVQREGPQLMDGEWIFVEDRTEGRTLEQTNPPMSSSFSMRVEEGAIILNGHGSGHRDVRVALDGTVTERPESDRTARYRGGWKDGAFEYEVTFERAPGAPTSGIQMIRRNFRHTADGLIVTVTVEPPVVPVSTGLYRHAQDIPCLLYTSDAADE